MASPRDINLGPGIWSPLFSLRSVDSALIIHPLCAQWRPGAGSLSIHPSNHSPGGLSPLCKLGKPMERGCLLLAGVWNISCTPCLEGKGINRIQSVLERAFLAAGRQSLIKCRSSHEGLSGRLEGCVGSINNNTDIANIP